MCQVVTPLQLGEWRSVLSDYPDQEFAAYILRGIENGFRVGLNPQLVTLQSARGNMSSAAEQAEVVDGYLREELAAKRVVHIRDADAGMIHLNPFGVIPKRNRLNKWRLIVDLSSPEGHSVNDGISKDLSSLSYVSVDDVVAGIVQRGRGTLLAKMDIRQAYRNVPIHPTDRPLLGMQWKGAIFVDAALPFGLRSAPLIFSAIADVLQWVMEKMGVEWVAHYIDDFITMGAPGSNECEINSAMMHAACERMGLPVEPEKDEGPATRLQFLGIELDSMAMELRLPPEKLTHLQKELTTWKTRKACKKRDLLSLIVIGLLSHACKVVRSGRSFLRRLIDLSTVPKHLEHYVRLNSDARSDIEWWTQFCQGWNGVSMMHLPNTTSPAAVLTSDASGNWGCGAYYGSNWFMLPWSGLYTDYHITVKELIPIVIAGSIWGPLWRGATILAQCDNLAVVSIVNHGTSKNREAMHLARCLAFITAKFDFHIVATHIKGIHNIQADALSRDNLPLFRSLHPQANQDGAAVPQSLLDLLTLSKPDWTSKRWTELWSTTFGTG
jgi:hypothetical protein